MYIKEKKGSKIIDNDVVTSRYIKNPVLIKNMDKFLWVFLVTFLLLPQYFGVPLASFDLTANRFFLVLFFLIIFSKTEKAKDFLFLSRNMKLVIPILLFEFTVLYTGILRADINAIMNPTIELLFIFLFYYLFSLKDNFHKVIKIVNICSFILCFQGLFEYITKINLFQKLQTLDANFSQYVRSGELRIMGPCGHALAYGLLLIVLIPFACINYKEKKIDLFEHKLLIILLTVNIFLTGSRSTLLIYAVEIVLLFLFSQKNEKKKSILFLLFGAAGLLFLVIGFSNLGISKYIMLQITSVIDTIFKTSFSLNYGAELSRLNNSSDYRKLLPKIFLVDYLNPLLGRGIKRTTGFVIDGYSVLSIDNYYIATYIRYAYPGLVTYVIIMVKMTYDMIKSYLDSKDGIMIAILIGMLCYYINVWWLDSLQTLRYLYLLVGFYYAYDKFRKNTVTTNN